MPLLIATDVAARGLDIKGVEYVINYTFPLTTEARIFFIFFLGGGGVYLRRRRNFSSPPQPNAAAAGPVGAGTCTISGPVAAHCSAYHGPSLFYY